MKRDSEAGVTIVELLVAISILAIISYALTESIIQTLRTADATAERFGESIDAQQLAASFGPDVHSADRVEEPFDPSLTACDGSSGMPVLLLAWTDGPLAKQATYTLEARSGDERRLVRRYCEADSRVGTSMRVLRQHVVANFVAPDASDPVAVSCPPSPSCSPQPRTVSMSITDASGYTFVATGSRRAT